MSYNTFLKHEGICGSRRTFPFHESFFLVENLCLDYWKVLHTETFWKPNQNSSMASLRKPAFEFFISESVYECKESLELVCITTSQHSSNSCFQRDVCCRFTESDIQELYSSLAGALQLQLSVATKPKTCNHTLLLIPFNYMPLTPFSCNFC